MEVGPGQQLGSTPELLDGIFEFCDLKTLMKARTVCKQWRSVSQLYLKRRMSILDLPPGRITVELFQKAQARNVLNAYQPPAGDLGLVIDLQADHDREKLYYLIDCDPKYPIRFAPLMAIISELEWISSVVSLELSACLTVDDWMAAGFGILKEMKALSSLNVELCPSERQVIPLCYAELQRKVDQDFRCESLRRVKLRANSSIFDDKVPEMLDPIVPDIIAKCTNLTSLTVMVQEMCWIGCSLSRTNSNSKETAMLDTWEAKCWYISDVRTDPFGHNWRLTPALARFFNVMLKIPQVQAAVIPVHKLFFQVLHVEPSVFINLKRIRWKYTHKVHYLWRGFPEIKFPNLHTVHLSRLCCEKEKPDDWVRLNLHKMAPNLERLVVNIFESDRLVLDNDKELGNLQPFLDVIKSLEKVKHVVLFIEGRPHEEEGWGLDPKKVAPYFQGLESITVFFEEYSGDLMLQYARCFIQASEQVDSLTKLGFYRRRRDNKTYFVMAESEKKRDDVDFTQLGVAIPNRVNVSFGPWTLEKVSDFKSLEGIEHWLK